MKRLISFWVDYYTQHPFRAILFVALLVRLVAVIFSKGYAMMDDHYLIIEQPQQWVDHYDENKWLPQYGATTPSGHSMFYIGIHYLLFLILQTLGVVDAQIKMYFIRLLHALWSMGIIYWGYLIVNKLSNQTYAKNTAWILSLIWLFPFLSVRQLVEFTCIPFFLWNIWLIIKNEKQSCLNILIAGFIGALSVSIRFQTFLIIIGIVLSMMMQKRWEMAIYYSMGALLSFVVIQGLIDFMIWKRPFAEFAEYVRYNLENKYNYFRGNWYNYILLILGLLLPPVSFFIFWGWIKSFGKYLILSLPIILFLLFHMYFPNRQERFILPILPLIIMQGTMGWLSFKETSGFWNQRKKLYKILVSISLILNFILLLPLTVMYSKRSYVEAMIYLKNKPITYLVIDDKNHYSEPIIPRFYMQRWDRYYKVCGTRPVTQLAKVKDYLIKHQKSMPNYFLFFEEENLMQRVDSMKMLFPDIKLDTIVYPGFVDKVMHFLNKHNKNQTIFIYKNENI